MSTEKKNIVIIGGGIIGSTTAYYLTRHPKYDPTQHKITLLEATSIASGASGKAGGLLALWAYPSSIVPLSFRLHEELAKEHDGEKRWGYRRLGCGQLSLKGRKISSTKSNSIGGEQKPMHSLYASNLETTTPSDTNVSLQKRSKESITAMSKAGLPPDLDWFADESVQSYDSMGTPSDTAQVHPYQFTTSMAALAEERGVDIILGSAKEIIRCPAGVTSVRYETKDTTESKILGATDVVVTAGPWTSTLWPSAPISALRAHSVTIQPARPVSAYAVFTSISLPKDFKDGVKTRAMHVTPEIYARPNNEVYACGEGDTLVPLPETSKDVVVDERRCRDIVEYVGSVSDELRDGEVLVRQACYLPQVEVGGGPLVGPTNVNGVWMAAGHTCWGIQNGPGTGKVMSEFVFEGVARSARVGGLDPRRVM
jgi:glycine/D-amino acid oxidase-like deaminating enzyme